jgi:N-acetylmuramoyl-L-alanine amidase
VRNSFFISVFVALLQLWLPDALSQNAPTMAKPNSGEGIRGFLVRNGLDPVKALDEFMQLNSGKFGKDNGLLAHHTYSLPSLTNTMVEPLFGEKYKTVTILSNTLSGTIFYLISGHGGPDPGASGKWGNDLLNEDEYAYDITLRLGRILMEQGATVFHLVQDPNDGIRDEKILAYDNDETCMGDVIPLSQVERLRQRVEKVNKLYKENSATKHQRSISIHLDSRSHKKQIDVFFYYYEQSKQGKLLAENLRNIFDEKYKQHQPSRGFSGTVSSRDLYELKYTFPVSVFVELGNIQNSRDQQRFVKPENRQALAQWLAEGFIRDYQLKSTPPMSGKAQPIQPQVQSQPQSQSAIATDKPIAEGAQVPVKP